jgi:hypothetical protein
LGQKPILELNQPKNKNAWSTPVENSFVTIQSITKFIDFIQLIQTTTTAVVKYSSKNIFSFSIKNCNIPFTLDQIITSDQKIFLKQLNLTSVFFNKKHSTVLVLLDFLRFNRIKVLSD